MPDLIGLRSLSRRTFLMSGAASVCAAPKTRPNFLFILADDHAGYVLGADGNSLARTPNLDRLASEGARFACHYCNSPVCTPSRQSFLTGLLPHAAGVTRLPTPLAPDKPTLARQFKKAGYRTAVFGKMHFNRPAQPGLHGFEELLTERELQQSWIEDVRPRPAPPGVRVKPPWRPFRDPARIWLNADTLPFPRQAAQMKGAYLADRAIRYMKQAHDRPFALWVSFMEPHSPFDFPLEYRSRILPSQFTPPRIGPEDGWQIPLVFRDLSEEDKRGIIASYYTSVSFLDWNIGRVLDALRDPKLDQNTYVVYMADHGYDLGHHGRFEKHCGYDPAMRVPLLMRWPGRVRQGVVQDLTEHVDVSATIADMMEIEPLPVMHGRSLRSYLETGRSSAPRDHIFSEYLENEEAFIRTVKWKYIFCSGQRKRTDGYETSNPTPGRYRRLFDLTTDSEEMTDVAAKNPQVIDRLESLMLERFRATHPERESEPQRLSRAEAIEFYLRPRDSD
jgi:arylsulfatase A-like enzyme